MLNCMRDGDVRKIASLGETIFQGGTSEVKNWIPVASAMATLASKFTEVNYVPCYRSEAGTGNAMGFGYWRP